MKMITKHTLRTFQSHSEDKIVGGGGQYANIYGCFESFLQSLGYQIEFLKV